MIADRVRASAAMALAGLILSGCAGLPRGGPMTSDISVQSEEGLEGLVAPLTTEVALSVAKDRPQGFPQAFLSSGEIDPTRLGVDDVLNVAVWENEETGLFSTVGGGVGLIEGVTIDGSGRIFLPFVGVMRAAGLTVGELRDAIRRALDPFTASPQVDVRLREARSRTLTVQGAVARPGPYVVERISARLAPMLALAGGATLAPEQAEVVVRRGGKSGAAMLEDIYTDPALDIALRPNDLIFLNAIRARFVVLGATRVQGEITFPTRELSLLRALGAARGLVDFDADPTGVFVFRWEDKAVADALLPAAQPEGMPSGTGRPIVYRLDLTRPEALFVAQSFQMRDGDAVFVTNAPLTELRKFLQLFTAVITPVQQGAAVATLP